MAETNATLTSRHAAYLGLDVGKFAHRAYAVDRDGEILLSRRVANSEEELDALLSELPADTLVVVDRRRSIGALAIRRARGAGRPVAYLPGSAEHELAKSFPGAAKTDERDAQVIARSALGMPQTVFDSLFFGEITGYKFRVSRQKFHVGQKRRPSSEPGLS